MDRDEMKVGMEVEFFSLDGVAWCPGTIRWIPEQDSWRVGVAPSVIRDVYVKDAHIRPRGEE